MENNCTPVLKPFIWKPVFAPEDPLGVDPAAAGTVTSYAETEAYEIETDLAIIMSDI